MYSGCLIKIYPKWLCVGHHLASSNKAGQEQHSDGQLQPSWKKWVSHGEKHSSQLRPDLDGKS